MATTRAAAAAASTPTTPTTTTSTPAYPNPFTSLSHSIEKLDGSMATGKSNYVAWMFRVLRILKEKGLAQALENTADDDPTAGQETTDPINDQAFTIISLTIRDSQIPQIQAATSTKEAGGGLAKVHQGIGSNGRMVHMQRLWSLHLKEGQDMSAHVNTFKEPSTQVANLSSDGVGIPDSDLVSMLSLSLPQSYEPLIMAVQSRADVITFDFLTGRLLQEATRRQAASSTTPYHTSEPLSAFTAGSSFRHGGGRGRGNTRWGNRGLGREMKGGSSGGGRGHGGLGQGAVSGRCHYCNKEGHWKNECYKRKGDLQESSTEGHLAFMGCTKPEMRKNNWIIDSGASRHLTAQRELLENYISIIPTLITIGNGKEINAIGQGKINIQTPCGISSLSGVLCVPDISCNLISVASIVDQGFQVEFSGRGCKVRKRNTERVIGQREGNLHFVRGLQEKVLAGLSNPNDKTTRDVWHERIAHRSLSHQAAIQITKSGTAFDLVEGDSKGGGICGVCTEGKKTREPLTGERR